MIIEVKMKGICLPFGKVVGIQAFRWSSKRQGPRKVHNLKDLYHRSIPTTWWVKINLKRNRTSSCNVLIVLTEGLLSCHPRPRRRWISLLSSLPARLTNYNIEGNQVIQKRRIRTYIMAIDKENDATDKFCDEENANDSSELKERNLSNKSTKNR